MWRGVARGARAVSWCCLMRFRWPGVGGSCSLLANPSMSLQIWVMNEVESGLVSGFKFNYIMPSRNSARGFGSACATVRGLAATRVAEVLC